MHGVIEAENQCDRYAGLRPECSDCQWRTQIANITVSAGKTLYGCLPGVTAFQCFGYSEANDKNKQGCSACAKQELYIAKLRYRCF